MLSMSLFCWCSCTPSLDQTATDQNTPKPNQVQGNASRRFPDSDLLPLQVSSANSLSFDTALCATCLSSKLHNLLTAAASMRAANVSCRRISNDSMPCLSTLQHNFVWLTLLLLQTMYRALLSCAIWVLHVFKSLEGV